MAYHNPLYLFVFLPLVLLVYQLTAKKFRYITLILAGYIFFWSFSKYLVLYLIATTLLTYGIGRWLDLLQLQQVQATANKKRSETAVIKKQFQKKRKLVLTLGIVILLAVLGYLKYYNFFAFNINRLVGLSRFSTKEILIPIGISYYTLQAIGYMADLYWGRYAAATHPGKIALYLGFFPQIMEGPISLYSETAEQLWKCENLKLENLYNGSIRIFWGLFKKMIIADRLNVLVAAVFDQYTKQYGLIILIGAIAYVIQLYTEFSGTMDMVIGSGQLFGIVLPENFRQPFFARNASDFWRRWHISLGVWFKTYIFYPISVSHLVRKWNQYGRKHCGKYLTKLGVSALCLFPVWISNGLWHGAKWNYIFYGIYYFVILMLEVAAEPLKMRLLSHFKLDENALIVVVFERFKTWCIIVIGELFFRADGVRAGWQMLRQLFVNFNLAPFRDGTLISIGLDTADYFVIVIGCLIVLIVGIIKERNLLNGHAVSDLALPIRWSLYYGLILSIVILGAYGIGYQQVDLIYAGF